MGSRFLAASVPRAAPIRAGGNPQGRRQSHQRAIAGQKTSKEGHIKSVETVQDFEQPDADQKTHRSSSSGSHIVLGCCLHKQRIE